MHLEWNSQHIVSCSALSSLSFYFQSYQSNTFKKLHDEHLKHVKNSTLINYFLPFQNCFKVENFFSSLKSTFRKRSLLEKQSCIKKFMILEQAPSCLAFAFCFWFGVDIWSIALCFSTGRSISKCICFWQKAEEERKNILFLQSHLSFQFQGHIIQEPKRYQPKKAERQFF